MVGSLTRVALARSGAGNSAEGTLVPFLLYRGLWAASTPGQRGRELGKFSSRPAQYTCICEPATPYLMTVSSTCGARPAALLR
jgi:hypothetical protein